MSFSIDFQQPVFKDTFEKLKKNIPEGEFIDKRFQVVPFSSNKTNIELKTKGIGNKVNIEVFQFGSIVATSLKNTKNISLVPENEKTTIRINLSNGLNLIRATDKETSEVSEVILNATYYATMLFSYAREIFNKSETRYKKQKASIFSPVSTRMAEILLGKYEKFIPDVQSLQVLSSKCITNSLVNGAASDRAVKELLTGMTLNTPQVFKIEQEFEIDHDIANPINYQEEKHGHELHTWVPSYADARWHALLKLSQNLKSLKVKKISDREIIIEDVENEEDKRFLFEDKKDNSFVDDQNDRTGFEGFQFIVVVDSEIGVWIQMPQYTHDLFITELNLLGDSRGSLDLDVPLDSSLAFDEDSIDPTHDGFIGLPLSGRFESFLTDANDNRNRDNWDSGEPLDANTPLDNSKPKKQLGFDTNFQKARADFRDELVYDEGYFTQLVAQLGSTVEISNPITMTVVGTVLTARDTLDQGIPLDSNVGFDDSSDTVNIPGP